MAWLRIQLARSERATFRELLQKIADLKLSGLVTLVLDEVTSPGESWWSRTRNLVHDKQPAFPAMSMQES